MRTTHELDQAALKRMDEEIEDAIDNDRPVEFLNQKYCQPTGLKSGLMLNGNRRKSLFIKARNDHVKRHLLELYNTQREARNINVYCVSNYLYKRAVEDQTKSRRRLRQSQTSIAQGQRAELDIEISGIPELRDFVQEIPSKSQILETRHFLETKVVALLEKTDMWLNARVPEEAASQPAAPEFIRELQSDLKAVCVLFLGPQQVTNSNTEVPWVY
jgi:hypothetical protein